ncbi:unnamed protein product, partial [Vitis vinifera]
MANGSTSIVDFVSSRENELQIICSDSSKKQFKFDHVFRPGSDQEAVFAQTSPIVTSMLDGYNVCIYLYHQDVLTCYNAKPLYYLNSLSLPLFWCSCWDKSTSCVPVRYCMLWSKLWLRKFVLFGILEEDVGDYPERDLFEEDEI